MLQEQNIIIEYIRNKRTLPGPVFNYDCLGQLIQKNDHSG